MNKKLLDSAIASALSLPALADTSNLQIYGLLDAGVDSVINVYNAGTRAQLNRQTDRVGNAESFAAMYATGPFYLTIADEMHDLATVGAVSMGIPLEAYTTVSALYEQSRDNFGRNARNKLSPTGS